MFSFCIHALNDLYKLNTMGVEVIARQANFHRKNLFNILMTWVFLTCILNFILLPNVSLKTGTPFFQSNPSLLIHLRKRMKIDNIELEIIAHPGYAFSNKVENVTIKVPKLWEPPGGRQKFRNEYMNRIVALSLGTKVPVDDPKRLETQTMETIYVSVASYRDWQCPLTVANIFERSKYPNRIRVGVIDQFSLNNGDKKCIPTIEECKLNPEQTLCKYNHLIDSYLMDAKLAVGPVFARHLGHRLYRGEYFAMQVDAHVSFVQDWDEDIVSQWKSANNEMAILTVYLSDVTNSIDEKTGKSLHLSRPIMCNTGFTKYGKRAFLKHMQQPEGEPLIHGTPTIEPYWAAGFSFGRGHFVVNVPYDQHLPMIFQGEEISMGLRAFTYGYDFYTPEKNICFHMYAVGENTEKRKKVKLFWENENLYRGADRKAFDRLTHIIKMNTKDAANDEWISVDEDLYGLGKVRTVEKFMKTFGIHLDTISVEKHLCRFVGRKMQGLFIPHLRKDGMGIDYSKIAYEFKDPAPNEEELYNKS